MNDIYQQAIHKLDCESKNIQDFNLLYIKEQIAILKGLYYDYKRLRRKNKKNKGIKKELSNLEKANEVLAKENERLIDYIKTLKQELGSLRRKLEEYKYDTFMDGFNGDNGLWEENQNLKEQIKQKDEFINNLQDSIFIDGGLKIKRGK